MLQIKRCLSTFLIRHLIVFHWETTQTLLSLTCDIPKIMARKDRFCLCFIKIRVPLLIKMLRNLFPVKHDKYVIKAFPKKSIFIHFKTFGMSSSIQKHKHKQNLHSLSLVIYISLISQCNVTSYQHL